MLKPEELLPTPPRYSYVYLALLDGFNNIFFTFRKRNDEETDIEGSVIFSFNITDTKIKMKDPVEVNVEKANSNGHGVERDIKMANAEDRTSLSVVSSTVDSMRSSSSSLAKSESSQDTPVSVLKSSKNSSSTSSKKVSIVTEPLAVVRRERDIQSPHGDKAHRASIIQVSADKRARKVKFFINGDKFFKGAVIAVNNEKFRTFDKLLEHMTKIMCNQVTLPNGVRYIFSLEGKSVTDMDCVLNGESYVCSSLQTFKKLDYVSLAGKWDFRTYHHVRYFNFIEEDHTWNRVKRDTYYLGMRNGVLKRDQFRSSGHSKSFQTKSPRENEEPKVEIKPRIITVLRSGTRPRKAVRVLLNNRNTRSLDMLLADLTNTVKLDTGAVRKIYTLAGKAINSLIDLGEEEVFIAYGVDKCTADDFDLDLIEFRNVQAILKSQKLDLKYEKFAHSSPKTSRKKFLSIRNGRPKRTTSKSRPPPASNGIKNGSCFHAIEDLHENYPSDVTEKYYVRQVVGDGNFAVVRVCYSRQTRKEFAVKIIDKVCCCYFDSNISMIMIRSIKAELTLHLDSGDL